MGHTWWPLASGEYRAEATHPIHGTATGTIELAPGADEELTLHID